MLGDYKFQIKIFFSNRLYLHLKFEIFKKLYKMATWSNNLKAIRPNVNTSTFSK